MPMEKRSLVMLGAVVLAIALDAAFVHRLQSTQQLGSPGLLLSSEPSRDPDGQPVGTNSVLLPEKVLNYSSRSEPVAHMVLDLLPKDTTYGQRLYVAPDGFRVSSTVVLMGSDRSSIHKPQICLTGQGWSIVSSTLTNLIIDRPVRYRLPVMSLRVAKEYRQPDGTKGVASGVYLYWFVSGDQLTADHWDRQWWMARDLMLRGLLQRWAYVTYFTVCSPGLESVAFERMRNLITESVPMFQKVHGAPLAQRDFLESPTRVLASLPRNDVGLTLTSDPSTRR